MSWLSTGVRRGSAGPSGDNRLSCSARRSVGQGAAVGTAAELPRTTSCTGYGAGLATASPRTEARTRAPTACPRSRRGWATVVSGGSAEWAGGESSSPTTDSRSGDRDAGILGGAQGAQGELVAEASPARRAGGDRAPPGDG